MKPSRTRRIAYTLVFLAIAGTLAWMRWHGMPWGAWRALANAEQYELLSLNPDRSTGGFYGHEILGQMSVSDAAVRERLNRAFNSGVRRSDGTMMRCFNPRHGIRVMRGGVTTDFVICFECRQVQVWRAGQRIDDFLTSNSPEPVFDEVLQQAGVRLAPKD